MSAAITLIAPVSPFRGGIARHSEAVAQALFRTPNVRLAVESFKRLYPALLYPGESDRDPSGQRELPYPVNYDLDTVAPWTWRIVAARIAKRSDVVVLPAWTFFVAPALGWLARDLRRKGLRVITLVHNVADHEASAWKSGLSSWQLAASQGFVTHSEALAAQLRAAGHTQPCAIQPHPPYIDAPEAIGSMPRERALELLCFGMMRHYKGVDIALRALLHSGLQDVRLTIAGEIWRDEGEIRTLARDPALRGKVELIDRYVSDAEAAELFHRCDAVLAPYRSVTGSGALAMAQRYRRPVIASDLPGLSSQIRHGHTGWLFPAGNELALTELLRNEATRSNASAMQANLSMDDRGDAWQAYSQTILDLAGRIGTGPGSAR